MKLQFILKEVFVNATDSNDEEEGVEKGNETIYKLKVKIASVPTASE